MLLLICVSLYVPIYPCYHPHSLSLCLYLCIHNNPFTCFRRCWRFAATSLHLRIRFPCSRQQKYYQQPNNPPTHSTPVAGGKTTPHRQQVWVAFAVFGAISILPTNCRIVKRSYSDQSVHGYLTEVSAELFYLSFAGKGGWVPVMP